MSGRLVRHRVRAVQVAPARWCSMRLASQCCTSDSTQPTARFVRGETRPRKSDGIYRAARRGGSTHMRDRVEAAAAALREANNNGEPAKLRLRETRRELERGWLATSDALRSQGQTALAEQTRHFVDGLPPARTEREWLTAGQIEQAWRQRSREVEMTR